MVNMERFLGRWEIYHTENLQAMMESIGMASHMREAMSQCLPQLEYSLDGDVWVMKIIMPHTSQQYRIQHGEEVMTTSIDGRQVKTLMKIEDDKFIEEYSYDGSLTRVIRQMDGDELLVTMHRNGIQSTARHKRVV